MLYRTYSPERGAAAVDGPVELVGIEVGEQDVLEHDVAPSVIGVPSYQVLGHALGSKSGPPHPWYSVALIW